MNLLRRAVEVVAYVAALGIGYRLWTKLMAELGGSQAVGDIARGRVSPWASDERPRNSSAVERAD